jgi:hypothetical protein
VADTSRFQALIAVAVVAAIFAAWRVVSAFRRRAESRSGFGAGATQRDRLLDRPAVLIVAVGCGMLVWAFVEPYFPVVRHVEIRSPKLHRRVKVVHISDLHCDSVVRAEERLVKAIAEVEPDLIVFSGDGVNSDEGIPVFRKAMRALVQIAPVYAVRGNWESWWFKHVDKFANTGVVVLEEGGKDRLVPHVLLVNLPNESSLYVVAIQKTKGQKSGSDSTRISSTILTARFTSKILSSSKLTI